MVINSLRRKTMSLKYRKVKTMDEECIDLGVLNSKIVQTADIFIQVEGTRTLCFQLSSEHVKLAMQLKKFDDHVIYCCL